MSFDGGRGPPNIEGMTSLKVDNLTYRTGIDDLKRVFGKHGDVGDIYIPRDKKHDHSRGFAFIRYWEKRDAEDAMDALDRTKVDGREIRVQMARYGRPTESYKPSRRDSYGGRDSGGRGSSYNSSRYRSRSRSRSPRRSRSRHSRSKSPRRRNSGSRSPKRRRSRSYSPRTSPRRSRSPVKRASHSRSRSRSPRHRGSKSRSPSRSPVRRSRSRSPVKRSPSRSPREELPYDGPNGEFTGNVNEEVED